MKAEALTEPRANPFAESDVEAILREQGWLTHTATFEIQKWMRDAAAWLGPQVASYSDKREKKPENLAELLKLVFAYDSVKLMENRENQAIMSRESAREVIRETGNRVLAGSEIDSERLREIIGDLKQIFGSQGRAIFYPLRLALAGRAGEGELDRVILLLDRAAKLPFCRRIKGTRQRMLEFCAALR